MANDNPERERPERFINRIRLTLERGDGECIDLGEFPDLRDHVSVSSFICRLQAAYDKCGYYEYQGSMEWCPRRLEFPLDASPIGRICNE